MGDQREEFQFKIDNGFLKFIGREMYSSIPNIISEMISNAWDADAEKVKVTLNTKENSITIEDDGFGMSKEDIKNKFLSVGYNKREKLKNNRTPKGRRLMGRKGIGKFAAFGIGNLIEINSKMKDQKETGIHLDYVEITEKKSNPFELLENKIKTQGTIIKISNFIEEKRVQLNRQVHFIHSSIFKNFLPIIENKQMIIDLFLDDQKIAIEYNPSDIKNKADVIIDLSNDESLNKIADTRVWKYEHKEQRVIITPKNNKKIKSAIQELKKDLIKSGVPEEDCDVSGYFIISRELKDLSLDVVVNKKTIVKNNFNIISIFANNKMGEQNILPKVKTNATYDRYVFGTLYCDFMESDKLNDIAISNRSGYAEEDERYVALINFAKTLVRISTNEKKKLNKSLRDKLISDSIPNKKQFLSDIGTFFKDKGMDNSFIKKFGTSSYQFKRQVAEKENELQEKSGQLVKKLFISHDSRTKQYGAVISKIFQKLGVREEEILFSSGEGKERIQFFKDFVEEIETSIRSARFAIYMLGREFYDSNISIAEAGAIWTKEMNYGSILLPGFVPEHTEVPLSNKRIGLQFELLYKEPENCIEFFRIALNYIRNSETKLSEKQILKVITETMDEVGEISLPPFIPRRRYQSLPLCTCGSSIKINYDSDKEKGLFCKCQKPEVVFNDFEITDEKDPHQLTERHNKLSFIQEEVAEK